MFSAGSRPGPPLRRVVGYKKDDNNNSSNKPEGTSSRWRRGGALLLLVTVVVLGVNFYPTDSASSKANDLKGYFSSTSTTTTTTTTATSAEEDRTSSYDKNDHDVLVRHVFHYGRDEIWRSPTEGSPSETGLVRSGGKRSSSSTTANGDGELRLGNLHEEEEGGPDVLDERDDDPEPEKKSDVDAYDESDLARPDGDDSTGGKIGIATEGESSSRVALISPGGGGGGGSGLTRPSPSEEVELSAVEEEEAEDEVTALAASRVAAAAKSGVLTLQPQIIKSRKSPKTFVYIRSKTCSYLCTRIKALGWKPGMVDIANKVYPHLLLLRWYSYDRYKYLTRTIINQVGSGSSCIGGGKGLQLLCRQQLAARYGCEYGDLGLQPKQYNLQKTQQCEEYFVAAAEPENAEKVWIMKPGGSFHGRGITLHKGDDPTVRSRYGGCKKRLPDGLIVQEYIMRPALMGGHKFDLRTYLLVASTAPFLVFYHDGFARRSEHPFTLDKSNLTDVKAHITNDVSQSEDNHFFGFHQLEESLVREFKFPRDYMERVFRPRAMRVTNFLFHTAADRTGHRIQPRPGRFQFFALDWMIDADGGTHLLEANGDPTTKDYPNTGLTPVMWDSMFELIELIHIRPQDIPEPLSVRRRFRHKGWRLVYNQLEAASDPYQPCRFNKYAEEKHPLYSYEP